MIDEDPEEGPEYALELPFDIDADGELDGLGPQEIFTLGVEWGTLYRDLENDARLVFVTIHTANAERLVRLCRRKGREPLARDLGHGWTELRFMSNEEAAAELKGGGPLDA